MISWLFNDFINDFIKLRLNINHSIVNYPDETNVLIKLIFWSLMQWFANNKLIINKEKTVVFHLKLSSLI